jgi:hypothetical protein
MFSETATVDFENQKKAACNWPAECLGTTHSIR